MVAIFVILTIVGFIMIDSLVQHMEAKQERQVQRSGAQSAGRPALTFAVERVTLPGGVFADRGHTWVGIDATGRARVGIDDFAQKMMGRIDGVDLPAVGQSVHKGEALFAIRQGERRAAFRAPIDGVISSVNESLARHPEAIKANPYRQGWVCSLRPTKLAKNLRCLFIAEEARQWIRGELERFLAFITASPTEDMALGRVLQDGGELTEGVLELVNDDTWRQFTQKFLHAVAADDEHQA